MGCGTSRDATATGGAVRQNKKASMIEAPEPAEPMEAAFVIDEDIMNSPGDSGSDDDADQADEEADSDLEAESLVNWDRTRKTRDPESRRGSDESLGEDGAMSFGVETEESGGENFMAVKPWEGAIVAPDDYTEEEEAEGEGVLDKAELELEWVHGFRGHDTRNNTGIAANGNLVYHAAALGIVLNTKTNEQTYFRKHNDDILCLSLHPNGKIAATGQLGKTPLICVWNVETMECLAELNTGSDPVHKRGVNLLEFSKSGDHLLSGDVNDDHGIAVWKWKQGKCLGRVSAGGDIMYGAAWSDVSENSFATCGVRHIKFWTVTEEGLESKKGLFGRVGPIETIICCAYWNGWCISGTTNGHLYVWKGRKLAVAIKSVHKNSIYALEVNGDTVYSSGKDGKLKKWSWSDKAAKCEKTWDIAASLDTKVPIQSVAVADKQLVCGTRTGDLYTVDLDDNELRPVVQGHGAGELWGLATHATKGRFVTCAQDKTLATWELKGEKMLGRGEHRMLSRLSLPSKARSVDWSPDGEVLAVGMESGAIWIVDAESLAVLHRKDGKERSKKEISDVRFSPDGTKLAVAGHDRVIMYYDPAQNYKQVAKSTGHTSFITHIDWSEDSAWIRSNCGGYELLFWDAKNGKQNTYASELKNTKWATSRCVLTWETQGVFPKYADGTDVNAVDRSHDGTLLATADDFGTVKLFKYPCENKDKPSKAYEGHSSHVTNVRWIDSDDYLVSTGGNDGTSMIWKVNRQA